MVRVVRSAVTHDLRVHSRAARLCVLIFFENERRAALAHDKAASALIKRAASVFRVGAGGQRRHIAEARHAHRDDGRFRAAGDDGIEIAVLNGAVRFTDLVVARRARRGDRQAGALRVELNGDVAARDIGNEHRDKVRGNAARALFVQRRHLIGERLDAADTGTEIHAEALRVDLAHDFAVVHRLRCRRDGKLRERVVLAHFALIHVQQRVKILDLRRHMRFKVRGVKLRDFRDAALAGFQVFPERIHVVADRGNCAETRDNYSSFHIFQASETEALLSLESFEPIYLFTLKT